MTRRSHILTIAFRGSPYYLDYKIREGVLYGKEKGILCGWGVNILTGIAHFSYEFVTRRGAERAAARIKKAAVYSQAKNVRFRIGVHVVEVFR